MEFQNLKQTLKKGLSLLLICLLMFGTFSESLVFTTQALDELSVNTSLFYRYTNGSASNGNLTPGNATGGNASSGDIITGVCGDDLVWILDVKSHKLRIEGTGDMYSYYDDGYFLNTPWSMCGIPIISLEVSNGVNGIGDGAFEGLVYLRNIWLPDSIKTIGENAFYNTAFYNEERNWESDVLYYGDYLLATRWQSIQGSYEIKDGTKVIADKAFYYNMGLTGVIIPENVRSIGKAAFSCCFSLNEVSVPKNVEYIGENAFIDCKSLMSINVDEDNKYYSSDERGVLFDKEKNELICYPAGNPAAFYEVPYSVMEIKSNAFAYSCLRNVDLPEGLITIGSAAFSDCYLLLGLDIPDSVSEIKEHTFRNCTSLQNVVIGNSVKEIGAYAFWGCSCLSVITFGAALEVIDFSAFDDCQNISEYIVDTNNRCFSSDENGVLFDKLKLTLIKYPVANGRVSYKIPENVITIDDGAFRDSDNLEIIEISYGVITIGEQAFYDCDALKSITIPGSVESTGFEGFYGCMNLKSVVIESGVEWIDYSCFADCSSLDCITLPNSLTGIDFWAFEYCSNLQNVYYIGTEEEWNEIDINWGNDDLLNANIHFTPCSHDNTEEVAETESTCIKVGYTSGIYCRDCKAWLSGHIAKELSEHAYSEWEVIAPATCNIDGEKSRYCSVCGKTEYKKIRAAHTDKDMDNICEVCGGICNDIDVNETKTVDVFDGEITYLRFTPEKSGRYLFYSENKKAGYDPYGYLFDEEHNEMTGDDDGCGDGSNFAVMYDLEVGRTYYWGVRYTDWREGEMTVTLICEEEYCDHINIIVHNHIEPTCTEKGRIAYYECPDCKKLFSDIELTTEIEITNTSISARGHNKVTIPAVEPTCASTGLTSGKKCSVCGVIIVPQEVVEKKKHSFGDWEMTVIPTPECSGKEERTCKNCGYTESKSVEYVPPYVNVTGVVLSETFISLSIGKTAMLTATVLPENATNKNVIWKSSDERIASVVDGVVTAKGNGTVFVTATTEDGNKTFSCTVMVRGGELDETKPYIEVSSANATIGDTVKVNVRFINNPGISAFRLGFGYDKDVLSLEKVEISPEVGGELEYGNYAVWYSGVDTKFSGDFLTLTFRVIDTTATGTTSVSIVGDDIVNRDEEIVSFAVKEGTIEICDYIPGDINNDGAVNNKDLTRLLKHLSGENVEVNESALDVNGDGNVNNIDLVRLMKYLAGADVVIH